MARLGGWALAALLVAASTQCRAPYLLPYRPFDLVLFLGLWALAAVAAARHRDAWLAGLLALSLVLPGLREGSFWHAWATVRTAPRAEVQRLAAHLVVGFRSWEDARHAALELGVGGLFLTARNVSSDAPEGVARRIAALQRERAERGLAPLAIAVDQEGGVVSRMSPPLPRQAPLAEVVRQARDSEDLARSVRAYAAAQGEGLRSLGVNVNFAPVLDLNRNVVSAEDRYTRVYLRALSSDPHVAGEVGVAYCQELERHGVRCTAKHFPGLGRVADDTHEREAALDVAPEQLAASDWIPFRTVLQHTHAWLMVGHVRLSQIDPATPASLSPRTLSLLRREWGFDRVLITDDLSMAAARKSPLGLERATAVALQGGADLLLISYDPDLAWPVLRGLLAAVSSGELTADALGRSRSRIEAALAPNGGRPL